MTDDEKNALIRQARDEYQNDIEIDDDARFSESDQGTWVSAWVWIAREEEPCTTGN